jgi:hypothetical protein
VNIIKIKVIVKIVWALRFAFIEKKKDIVKNVGGMGCAPIIKIKDLVRIVVVVLFVFIIKIKNIAKNVVQVHIYVNIKKKKDIV